MVVAIIIAVVLVLIIDFLVLYFKTARSIGEELGASKKDSDSLATLFIIYNLFKGNDKK